MLFASTSYSGVPPQADYFCFLMPFMPLNVFLLCVFKNTLYRYFKMHVLLVDFLNGFLLLHCRSLKCGVGNFGETSSSALEFENTHLEQIGLFLTEPLLQHTRTHT